MISQKEGGQKNCEKKKGENKVGKEKWEEE